MKEKIVLDSVSVSGKLVKYDFHVSPQLERYFNSRQLFIEYEQDISQVPISILSIPFVACFAGLSWLSNAMLFVDELDRTYYQAFTRIKNAYAELHDAHMGGILVPSVLTDNEILVSENAVLLYGGGVDCISSYLRHPDTVSCLLNINGWLQAVDEINAVDYANKQNVKDFASRMGIEGIHARSNFAALFNLAEVDKSLAHPIGTTYWYGFLHSMAFLSIAAPLAFNKGISHIIIASSFTKDKSDIHCASYITTDSEFKFAAVGSTLHDGFELSRQAKVALLVQYQQKTEKPFPIQACSFNDHNCCSCEKCFRTIIALVAEGADPRMFGFDVQGSLVSHFKQLLSEKAGLWGVSKESYYYELSRERIKENYSAIKDKEFADWFMGYDFGKAKRQGVRKYYCKNFWSILKRKLKKSI